MTDPETRQKAIDWMTQVLLEAGKGSVDENDARQAATAAVDQQIKKRGG